MNFHCSNCGYSRTIDSSFAGKKVSCPKCKTPNRILAPPSAPPPINTEQLAPSINNSPNSGVRTLIVGCFATAFVTSIFWAGAWYLSVSGNENSAKSTLTHKDNLTAEESYDDSKSKKDVIATLKKLQSFTSVGLTYRDYVSKLPDVKAEFDTRLNIVKDQKFKKDARNVMAIYKDAGSYWNDAIQYKDITNVYFEFEGQYHPHSLSFKYKKYDTSHVSEIWSVATLKLTELEYAE